MTKFELEKTLREMLQPAYFEIIDKSSLHGGHHGFKGDEGTHFRCLIVSEKFEGKQLLERHKLVYDCLPGVMGKQIHALALKTLSLSEWDQKRSEILDSKLKKK